jgi:CHAT domain-containing protein
LLASLISRLPPGIARLVIVPDRGLHGIPWDLLRLRDGRALVERYAVSLASSASVLARLVSRPRRDAPVSVLAFGAPRWPDLEHGAPETAALRAAVRAQGGLAALPAALEEARRLRRRAPAGDVRTGRAASEASLKRQPAGYRILHFATHAVVDDRSIERTALALAPGDGDDGFLLPAELARLPLDADLFALVACRTARGPVAGSEGVQGLAYAALEAGARSVLASEWSVSDDASAAFVDAFYSAIASGLDTGEALVRAKREALAAGRPARDWAAFTLIGDPYVRLALGEPANGAPITILAVSAVLVLAAGYGVMMRRRHSELMREPSTRKASTRH